MADNRQPVRIAVNVMRARLTVIGFNIAIVSFQIGQLYRTSGGITVSGLDHRVHVGADMALFMALALSLISLVAFIMSGSMDEVGYCTHWTMLAGDLFMYLGLAQTMTGYFAPLAESMTIFSSKLPSEALQIDALQLTVLITGGFGWFLAMYIGPLVSLCRSPFAHKVNVRIGAVYLAVLIVLFWVNAQSVQIEALSKGQETNLAIGVLQEMVQPFRW